MAVAAARGWCSSQAGWPLSNIHLSEQTKQTGLAIGGADGSGGDSKADLAALRELLLAAKQEHDALAKAKAQAEERTERLEYRVSMLVASLREADKALGKPAPPPMPQRRPTAAAAAPAADEDEDEAAVA